jgi:hypothetical protein
LARRIIETLIELINMGTECERVKDGVASRRDLDRDVVSQEAMEPGHGSRPADKALLGGTTMWIPLWIKEHSEVRKNQRAIRQIDMAYDVELANAKSSSEREKAEYGRHWEVSLHYDQIEAIKTRRLLRKAYSLDVPYEYPREGSPLWEQSHQLHTWNLTTLGYSEVRKAIRQERRDRRESAITWAGVIIGTIGSLTGLLSVWLAGRAP